MNNLLFITASSFRDEYLSMDIAQIARAQGVLFTISNMEGTNKIVQRSDD